MIIAIKIIHAFISLGLIVFIMLQSEGGGLGSAFGGAEVYHTKRGLERFVFLLTVTCAVLFSVTSLGLVFFS